MLSAYYNKTATDSRLALKVNYTDTSAMLSNYYRAYSSPIFNLPAGTNIDSVVTRNPNTGALTLTTPLDLIKYANGIVATDTALMLSPYVRNNSLQTGGYLKYSDTASTLSTLANRNKLRDSLLSSANTWSLTPTFSTMKKGGVLFAGTNGLLSQDSAHLFFDNTNERLVIGAATFDATNPEALKVISSSSTSKNAIAASGTVNDFLQYNIQNLSTGVQAKSGYSSTADNGTITTGFAWMGINNSQFNYPTAYNIGTANDVSFLGSGLDMNIANANQSKSIIFSTGKAASPFFNERMRITNAGRIGIGTNAPDTSALLDLTSSSKGLLMPRVSLVSLSDASTILLPAASLMVYNINAGLTGGVGYYYNSGTTGAPSWIKLASTGAANGSTWGLTGNSSTTAGTNFIGTTDNIDLVFKRNNLSSGFLGATNTAFGNASLPNNSTAINSAAFGYNALNANTASGISAFGYNALAANTSGASNAAFGYNSLYLNTTGANNAAFGYSSLAANTGSYNSAFGTNSLLNNTTGTTNAAFGYNALASNTTGASNTAVGYSALGANNVSGNSAFGYYALAANNSGTNNVAVGYYSLAANTTGANNAAVGYNALAINTTGSSNTAIGNLGLSSNTTGLQNTAIGNNALFSTSTGGYNTATGASSLSNNVVGNYNSAFGYNALLSSNGSSNTALGYNALQNNTTGSTNTAIGYNTGLGITTGTNNTIIGSNVTGLSAALSNTIILADGAGNQRMYINNSGQVGIGTTTPSAQLNLKGGHIRSQQTTAPTIAVTTANGITAAAIASNSTDMKGNITTTGTNNGVNTALTVTFRGASFSIAPVVIITSASASAQYTFSYVQATTSGFTLYFYNFQTGSNPSFNYMVIE